MAVSEHLGGFLVDFGVPVVFGATTALGILDEPTEVIAGGMVLTVDYQLTYETADLLGMGYQSAITVNGASFIVREVRAQDDGSFSVAYLSKV